MNKMENDFLFFSKEPEIISAINSEPILYSNKIQKMKLLIKQERNLVITPSGVYTFHNKKLKKTLKYEDIKALSFSSISNEFIIHRKNQYDFHYLSHDKIKLICCLIRAYDKYMKTPIVLCEIKDKSLKPYVTTKKEKKKDINATRMDKSKIIDTQTFLIDNEQNFVLNKTQTDKGNNISNNINFNFNMGMNNNFKYEVNNINLIFSKEGIINGNNIKEKNFKYRGILGRGKFCKIYLVENSLNKKYYAVKSVNKKILNENYRDKIEKKMKNLFHNFLVNILLCYETNEKVEFFFEYIHNEDLFSHLYYNQKIKNKKINEEDIKFYTASIILVLEYLHKNGIIYRNITPKNILIDKEGYIKLTPFSVENFFNLINIEQKNNNIVINEYTSPEALNNESNLSSDFWNLGVIIYEMIYGIPPFYALDNNNLSEIINKKELKFPKNFYISDELKNLVEKLLEKNFEERLGSDGDIDKIKNHDFFKNFNFEDLINKKMESPYKPSFGNNLKNNNFEEKYNYDDLIKAELIETNL